MRLQVKNVCFNYGSWEAIRDVKLEARAGEVLSIIGPNGAGKSTLLRCINRILKPRLGTIYLDGDEISLLPERERAKKLGYVPQAVTQPFSCTVYETVLMGRRPYLNWSVSRQDLAVVEEVLRQLGLSGMAGRMMSDLSGGEMQKVLIARALAQEPEVLLLDEPTSNLDVRHQLEVLELVRDAAHRQGKCVLMVMHDINVAGRFSDQMLMLKGGQVFAAGSPWSVLTRENIKAVYEVDSLAVMTTVGPQIVVLEPGCHIVRNEEKWREAAVAADIDKKRCS
ncbi:MAG: ABC transporter ATP-binding protein [Bacillota bacterium]